MSLSLPTGVLYEHLMFCCQDSSVNIVTTLRDRRSRNHCTFPNRRKLFFDLKYSAGSGAKPASYSKGKSGITSGRRRSRHKLQLRFISFDEIREGDTIFSFFPNWKGLSQSSQQVTAPTDFSYPPLIFPCEIYKRTNRLLHNSN